MGYSYVSVTIFTYRELDILGTIKTRRFLTQDWPSVDIQKTLDEEI